MTPLSIGQWDFIDHGDNKHRDSEIQRIGILWVSKLFKFSRFAPNYSWTAWYLQRLRVKSNGMQYAISAKPAEHDWKKKKNQKNFSLFYYTQLPLICELRLIPFWLREVSAVNILYNFFLRYNFILQNHKKYTKQYKRSLAIQCRTIGGVFQRGNISSLRIQ